MTQETKHSGTCGFWAMLAMLIFGGIFGSIGIAVAHLLTKHAYFLILLPAIALGIILGLGLNVGAKIGRCSRFNVLTFLLVTLFVLGSYVALLFLNVYHDSFETPPTLVDEKIFLIHDTWNLGAELPFVSDYVKPVTIQDVQRLFSGIPFVSDFITPREEPVLKNEETGGDSETPPETPPALLSTRPNLASQVMTFFSGLPEQALSMDRPVPIGTMFNLAVFAPLETRFVVEGITRWDGEGQDKRLVFDERAVQPWMLWSAELLLSWFIALLMTRSGTKKVLRRQERRRRQREQPGLSLGSKTPPADIAAAAPEKAPEADTEEKSGKKKVKVKKEKSGGWFGRKKEKTSEEPPEVLAFPEEETPSGQDELEFGFSGKESEEEKLLALILHQYAPERQEDLVRLIKQVGGVPEMQARRLLKVPSLIKRDITPQQANIAIEKFNQVQAQVKLITMEQLLQLQNKQQQSAQAPSKKLAPNTAPVAPQGPMDAPDARYALILRKFDAARRKDVLDLLSALSGTPVNQLQQSLKTPALVLRDASKDEATMIVQQFKNIQADVKMLTMPELQKLMTKK